MATVAKVTVSLPVDLLARIEDRRHNRALSRSAVVTELLWQGWRHAELAEREQRYRASYQEQPETEEERAWAAAAVGDFFDGGGSAESSDWDGGDDTNNHAPG